VADAQCRSLPDTSYDMDKDLTPPLAHTECQSNPTHPRGTCNDPIDLLRQEECPLGLIPLSFCVCPNLRSFLTSNEAPGY